MLYLIVKEDIEMSSDSHPVESFILSYILLIHYSLFSFVAISRRGKFRRRRTHCKWGNNEESPADKEDAFSEEYECLNSKFQFAIDLKNKDILPGKQSFKYTLNIPIHEYN